MWNHIIGTKGTREQRFIKDSDLGKLKSLWPPLLLKEVCFLLQDKKKQSFLQTSFCFLVSLPCISVSISLSFLLPSFSPPSVPCSLLLSLPPPFSKVMKRDMLMKMFLGVDHTSVRFIVHYGFPQCIEQYVFLMCNFAL